MDDDEVTQGQSGRPAGRKQQQDGKTVDKSEADDNEGLAAMFDDEDQIQVRLDERDRQRGDKAPE